MEWRVVKDSDVLMVVERHLGGIVRALAKNDTESADHEDVLRSLQNGQAILLEAVLDGVPRGGVVVQFLNRDTLHVWLAWRIADGGRLCDWWKALCKEAARRKFRAVSAASNRPFGRVCPGFVPRATVFEADLWARSA